MGEDSHCSPRLLRYDVLGALNKKGFYLPCYCSLKGAPYYDLWRIQTFYVNIFVRTSPRNYR